MTARSSTLLLRVDAGQAIGHGHVMRCRALAQAWIDAGGSVQVLTTSMPAAVRQQLEGDGVAIESASERDELDRLRTLAGTCGVVVIDGYQLGEPHRRAARSAGAICAVVDDAGGALPEGADVVLNQNVYATDALYPQAGENVRILAGPRYALLRREFWSFRDWQRPAEPDRLRALVTMGGSDPLGLSPLAARALVALADRCTLSFVLGASASIDSLRAGISNSLPSAHILTAVDDMAGVMAATDIALTAAGSTCLELAFMQIPMLMIAAADNQRPVARGFDERGAGMSLGDADQLDPAAIAEQLGRLVDDRTLRDRMRSRGRSLVPGDGASAVAKILADMATARTT